MLCGLFKSIKKIHDGRSAELSEIDQSEKRKRFMYQIQGDANQAYNYIKDELLEIMGLENQVITFGKASLSSSAAVTFFDKEGNFAIRIFMDEYNNPEHYKTSLAHELWHVKTGLELINKIGEDAFRDLVYNNHEASLAFRTIFEYMAWSECIKNYDEKESGIDLPSIFGRYFQTNSIEGYPEDYIVTDIAVCDAIASYSARKHNVNMSMEELNHSGYVSLADNYKKTCDAIGELLLNVRKWPMEVAEFEAIGIEMKKIFREYIPLPKTKIII